MLRQVRIVKLGEATVTRSEYARNTIKHEGGGVEKAELAVVAEATPLCELLQSMQNSGHAAALVQSARGLNIVTAGQVSAVMRRHKFEPKRAGDVESSLTPSFLPNRSAEDSWTRRPEATQGLSYALGIGQGKYAVLSASEDRALVLTADPLLTESFNVRISLCRCKLHPTTHVFQPQDLTSPGQCPLDESKVDCS